ncbi:uncharacterized protein LOC129566055 [Sitodiplosis mosellana]|uniref:uncharacterized protein LOC129566055 n=1 Tax=Sitodiplosis mosellana TaxID=263140 RepID=UPI0024444877|nr:uncharacterized protein LOC129566055 [Sitodiplosis mosellana]
MPFIWDDSEWMLIDNEDSYDKSRFVVARKLCVRPTQLDVANEGFSIESIRRHFRKFGEIESIELLPNNEPEAHVTFVSDRIACFVQSHFELDTKMNKMQPYEVEPAYTWEQPLENANPPPGDDMEVDDEQTSEIFRLDEDCLLHMFKFLDIDSLVNMAFVCKLFNQLLRLHCFPRIQKYKVYINNPTDTLAKVRRTMLCIGQHITDLSFRTDLFYGPGSQHRSEVVSHTSKYLKVIAQNVSQNVRQAFFCFGFNGNLIGTIAPILQNLRSLTIVNRSEKFENEIDFNALCPNLIEFNVNAQLSMDVCCKPWSSLRSISVMYNNKLEPEKLISIIEQNPQLTCLRFAWYSENYRALFPAITKHLASLEKLDIWCNPYHVPLNNNFVVHFDGLGKLPLLREISLGRLEVGSLKGVVDNLPKFTNLRKIELTGCSGNNSEIIINYGQSMVNLARKLLLLEELTLDYIPMEEETLLDIVRFGRQLKVLYVYQCKLVFSDELIFKLVDALKCYREESDEALQLLLPQNDLDRLDAAKKIEGYLQLKRPETSI